MGVEDYNKTQLERLREHKIAFDQEAMWAAMQKKKKRRGALYFFTMALVALAIVFFTCFLFSWFSGENSTKPGEKTSYNGENENNTKIENETVTIDNLTKSTTLNSDKNKISITSKTDLLNSNENKKPFLGSNNNLDTEENEDDLNSAFNRSTNRQPPPSNSPTQTTSNFNRNDNKVSNLTNTSKNQTEKKSDASIKTSLNKLINIQPLKIYEFPYLESLRNLKVDLGEPEMTPPLITEVIKEPKSRFHIGAYGGVGYLFRQYSNGIDTSSLNSEALEEVSIGLELKYQLAPNFFVRSGIEYWHATEKKETPSYSIINTNDLETFVPGMEEGIRITTTYSKVHTIYQSYNVPLILGWNTNNDKWNLFAEAGFLYNFKTERKREETFASTEENKFEVGSQNQISPIAGVGVSFSPTNRVELFARSNWRGNQNVTLSGSPESLNYGAIRTHLGVRIGI